MDKPGRETLGQVGSTASCIINGVSPAGDRVGRGGSEGPARGWRLSVSATSLPRQAGLRQCLCELKKKKMFLKKITKR